MKRVFMAAVAGVLLIAAITTASAWVSSTNVTPSSVQPLKAASPSLPSSTAHVTPAQTQLVAQTWHGYYRVGAADQAAHTKETEPLVAPLAKVGFKLGVPEGVTVLAFRLDWQGSAKLHEMAHAPMDDKHAMDTYMSSMGGEPSPHCLLIPTEKIKAGTWEPMAMNMDNMAVNTDFTITVVSAGSAAPKILDELHGHPLMDDWSMTMREARECTPEILSAVVS